MSDREQAIKDVAKAFQLPDELALCFWPQGVQWAVFQRERVIQLERDNRAKSERVIELERALRDAEAANERDRTSLHKVVHAIDEQINGRLWLLEGRGCYEWDDDRYRQEFGWAVHALQEKLGPLRKIAGDLKNCPATQKYVDAARAALRGESK